MTVTEGALVLRRIRRLAASTSDQPDVQLLQQFIADADEAAFATLVKRHGSMVLGLCRSVLHHQQDAEDVFQATFLVLARRAHTIRKHQSLASWLHGVAYRLALKAKARTNRQRDRDSAVKTAVNTSTMDDLTLGELRLILHEELQGLPEKYRAALLLCYWEGKTRDEAAEQLSVTAGSFKKCLERARNLLGSRLVRRGLVPSAAFFSLLFAGSLARAAMSNQLTERTAQAAVAYAAGKTTAASTAAIALAEGVLRTMAIIRYTKVLAIALLVTGFCAGLGLMSYQMLDAQQLEAGKQKIESPNVQPKNAGKMTDEERIVGTWRFVSGSANGQAMPEGLKAIGRFVFTKDGKASLRIIDEGKEGTYKIVGPGKIDITLTGDTGLGIYKFDGDNRLTLSIKEPKNAGRPTEFSGDQGTNQMLFVLERAKPGDDKLSPKEIAKIKEDLEKARGRAQSTNDIKQIGLAIHGYHDTYNALPAHAIYDKDEKKPLLSWRVAILPFIEGQALYNEFKLDEPWDSPNNKKLIAKMPLLYHHPMSKKKPEDGLTHYQVFTGPGTLFDGPKKMKLNDVTDGTSNTLMLVEAKNPIIWTKPDELQLPKEKDKLPPLGGLFPNGFHIGMCDGSVRMLPANAKAATIRALVTPDGQEPIEE